MDQKELEEELAKRVARAKETGVGNFNNLGLSEIPTGLFDQLGSLVTLRLDGNQLTGVSAGLFDQLGSLTTLRLDYTQLTEIPAGLFDQLGSLNNLELDINRLTKIPVGIFDQLSSLTSLRLNSNHLTEIPVGLFDQLGSLTELYLNDNKLTKIPAGLFDQLGSLSILNLQSNKLTEIPAGLLDQNSLLESLSLQFNELREIPEGFFDHLDSLEFLSFSSNPLPDPLFAAFDSGGIKGLRAHLRSRMQVGVHYEGKILLVGEGDAGKTTLVKALENLPSNCCEEETQQTHATEIHPFAVPHPDDLYQKIRLNCWDFGGQADYRPAHQLFFSAPAIYLVVYDARQGADKWEVEDWLRRIQERGGKDARVLVVGRIDEKESGRNQMPPTQEQQGQYAEQFPDLVCDYLTVDSRSGYGIPELRAAIVAQALRDNYFKQHFEEGWREARDALAETKREVVTRDEFGEICAGAGLKDPEAIERFARIHQILGHLIYFAGDEDLSQTVILQPDWLSQAIGHVLIDTDIKQQGLGIASHKYLAEIWDLHDYCDDYHALFIELMERYELSFREGDSGQTLVAPLVQPDRPIAKFQTAWPEELPDGMREQRVIFRWRKIISDTRKPHVPIPEAFFFTLIARFNLYSLGHEKLENAVHWSQGLVLKHEVMGDALLEVKDGDLHVVARGARPSAMISFLRFGIEQPHQRFDQHYRGLERDYLPTCGGGCTSTPGFGTTTEKYLAGADGGKVPCSLCEEMVEPALFEATAPDIFREIRRSERRVISAVEASGDELLRAIIDGQQVEQEKLDELIASAESNADQMLQLRGMIEESFLRLYRDLTSSARERPWLFWARPEDGVWLDASNWVKKTWIIYLYCEHHRMPVTAFHKGREDFGGVYRYEVPKEGYAGFLGVLNRLRPLLYLCGAAGAAGGIAIDQEAMFKSSKGVFDTAAATDKLLDGSAEGSSTAAMLKRVIDAKDKELENTGLVKVYDNARGYLWVHPTAKRRYDLGPPKI